jgi:hypothetical protein
MAKQRKQVKVSLVKIMKIIELLSEFSDYEGLEDIHKKIAGMLRYELNDSEIEEYSNWYLSREADELGYDKDNYDNAISILENFRKEYCQKLVS